MSKQIPAAGYVRVSDDDQVDGFSLDGQRREIEAQAQREGFAIVSWFADEGVSAYVDDIRKRPQFQAMLGAAEHHEFEAVFIHTLDRWARKSRVQLDAFHRLGQAGVGFRCLSPNMDFTTPQGKLMLSVMGAVNEFQSDQIAEHVRKARKERAHQGLPVAPTPPFGYDPPPPATEGERQRNVPRPNPQEAPAIVRMFTMKAKGFSNRAIANWLNAEGFQTRNRHRGGRVKRFTNYSVRDLLKNNFFIGEIEYDGEIYPGKHEPIVDRLLFDAVQARRGTPPKVRDRGGAIGALKGLARCWGCGGPLWVERNWKGYALYREPYHRDCATTGKSFRTTGIDEQIGEIFGALTFDASVLEQMAALTVKAKEGPSLDDVVERRRRLGIAFEDGMIDEPEYRRRKAVLADLAAAATPVTDVTMSEAVALFADFPALWDEATPAERGRLLSPLVDAAWIDICTRRIAGLSPTPAFHQIVEQAVTQSDTGRCLVMDQVRAEQLIETARQNGEGMVWMVETRGN